MSTEKKNIYEEFVLESLGKRVNDLFRLSMMYFRNEMKKIGFGAGDYAFIALLFVKGGLSQDELSKLMRVDKSYTARALAKLEKIGMVERRPDPEEHRIKRVCIGAKAREIESDFFNILRNWHDTIAKGIEPDHLDLFRTMMDKMISNAEVHLGLEENKILKPKSGTRDKG